MGLPIAYHVIDSNVTDPETGLKTTVLRVINIKEAIVLDARTFRSFVYDIAYLSANKDFTMGGFFDPEDRRVILDPRDLKAHVPKIEDYFVFNNARYDIKEVNTFENNFGYELLGRKVRGQEVTRIVTRLSGLILTDEASAVVVDRLTREASNTLVFTQSLVENV